MKLQVESVFYCLCKYGNNENIICGNKWALLKCETVRKLKYVVHVLGRGRIIQIQTAVLTTTTRLSTL